MAQPGQIADVRLPAALANVGGLPGDALYSVNTSSLTATGTLFSVNTDGTNEIAVQVTSAGTTCTITYETSNDGATWVSAAGSDSATPATVTVTTTTTAVLTIFKQFGLYFRARVSTYGSGTVSVVPVLRSK